MTPWFSRTFVTDLPCSRLPGILERLRGTPARLEESLRDLRSRVLLARVGGAWSIQENAGHLLDLEPLWRSRVEDVIAGRSVLSPADLDNRLTHEARHNERPLAPLLAAFRRERSLLVATIEGASPEAHARQAVHPRLQIRMRIVDLAYFVAEHDDHHLARMTELARALAASASADA